MAKVGLDEIYALSCPETGEVRYIGKARDTAKRLKTHLRDCENRRTPVCDWVKSLRSRGLSPVATVVFVTWDWQLAETEVIAQYWRDGFRLLNLAPGGNAPICNRGQLQSNGRGTAKAIHGDPLAKRIWRLKRAIGSALKEGYVTDSTKQKLRLAAQKSPGVFGAWAAI